MGLELDRMAVEEVGANPERLAKAILDQLGGRTGSVPVYDIARALDIDEIREERLTGFEGALVTSREKDRGIILVNLASSRQRRRYTVAHELGHFLNPWHKPVGEEGFRCKKADMATRSGNTRHDQQEAEANRFAIELLAPKVRLAPYVAQTADLEHVLAIAAQFDISKEAAARRYVELHDDTLAVVFSRDRMIRYVDRSDAFPSLALRKDDRVPVVSRPKAGLSRWEEVDARDWLRSPSAGELLAQTLQQQEGFCITLLHMEAGEDNYDELRPPSWR
jgi:Zn-dependent peptidase ImmA (M78 family)